MEHEHNTNPAETTDHTGYVPRPAWQVWVARICLILFVGLVICYYIGVANGGLS